MLALALGAALAAYPALSADRAAEAVGLLGAAGAAAVALTLAGGIRLLPLPLLLLAAELELQDVLEPVPHVVLPLYAAGLLLLGELVSWSLGLRAVTAIDRAVVTARIRFLLATAIGAAAVAAVAVAASTVHLAGGLGDAATGIAATVLLLGAISLLARPEALRRRRA